MKNLVWTNANPDGTPCPVCQELIGCVFDADSVPPCPVHPSCYCLLMPTDQEVNTTADATGFSDSSQETWAKYTTYLLRKGFDVPTFLQPLEARQAEGITRSELGQYGELMRLEDITPDSLSGRFWQEHWTEALPPSGKGDFTYQNHWRGLDEDEANLDEEDLLKTTHSVHGDLRCSFGKALWGFTCFLGTTEDIRNGRDLPRLDPDDALQGSFKLFKPTEWLTIAREGPFLSEPADIGATSRKYAKFFEVAHGAWEVGVWREHSLEIFLTSPAMSGRYLISYAPVGEGERVWTIRKPRDQTPIFDKEDKEELIAELRGKDQRYLVWSKPGQKPELIDIVEEP